jgi:hypothetical protein
MKVSDLVKWTPKKSHRSPLLKPCYIGLIMDFKIAHEHPKGDLVIMSASGRWCTWKSSQCEVISESR